VPLGIRENRTKKPYGAARCSLTTPDIRQAALLLRLGATSRFPLGHVVHESINVFARNGRDPELAQERLNVPLDTAAISSERAWFFSVFAPRQ
jgi:hypothetical protein